MVAINDLTLSNRSTTDGWILWLLQYSLSVRIDRISSMTGSCDVEIAARKVNFCLGSEVGWWLQVYQSHLVDGEQRW